MKLKKAAHYILKLSAAAIISLAILSSICYFYYNVPVHFTNNEEYTDYVWESNKFYSRGIEGFSSGKTNNEGLNNTADYNGQNVDILMIGSSQFEGFNVKQNENMASLLNNSLGDSCFVYNIGVSGHEFLRCTQNFENAMEKYKPSQYVILEVSDLFLKSKNIDEALNNNIQKLNSSSNRLLITLEKMPLLRHFYNQLDNAVRKGNDNTAAPLEYNEDISQPLEFLLSNMADTAEKYNTKIVLLYHNSDFDENMQLSEQKDLWINVCDKCGIKFIDMTDDFKAAADDDKYVYGFINTLPNSGHLNKYGHALIAQRIYKYITSGE